MSIGLALVERMGELTRERHGPMALANAERNRPLIGKSLACLRNVSIGEDEAIVIASGPSVAKRNPGPRLKDYRGALIAADSAFVYCLRHGRVPDLVVTVDPHPTRIVRWFGDPAMETTDDYFRRQDLEPRHEQEIQANAETLDLMARHAKGVRIALSTSSSEAVVKRVHELGMDVHWWNPMHDDPDEPDSITARLFEANRLPCVNAGGNVGSAAWMMAHAVLGKKRVALVGFDFAYYPDTPYTRTQYYREAVDLVGSDNLDQVFMRIHNPYLGQWFYTDPAYMWYRTALLDMARDADCKTINCTEGGIVFGDAIDFQPLDSFLT